MAPPRLVHPYHSFSHLFVFPRVKSKVFNGPVWKKKVVVDVYKAMTNLEKVSTKYPICSSKNNQEEVAVPKKQCPGDTGVPERFI